MVVALLDLIEYKGGSGWRVGTMGHGTYIQHYQFLPDCTSEEYPDTAEKQHGRKWYISPHATRSEILQTALAAVLAFEEHEARECFRFRGNRLYGPHIAFEALERACDTLEARE